jgi:hypothetical protein
MGRLVALFLLLLLGAVVLLERPWERAAPEPAAPEGPSLPIVPLPELPPVASEEAVGTYLLRSAEQRTRLLIEPGGRFHLLSERFDGQGQRSSRGTWRQEGNVVEMTYTEFDGVPAEPPYVVARNTIVAEGLHMTLESGGVLLPRVVRIDAR